MPPSRKSLYAKAVLAFVNQTASKGVRCCVEEHGNQAGTVANRRGPYRLAGQGLVRVSTAPSRRNRRGLVEGGLWQEAGPL